MVSSAERYARPVRDQMIGRGMARTTPRRLRMAFVRRGSCDQMLTRAQKSPHRLKREGSDLLVLVAGAGFEPATFGL